MQDFYTYSVFRTFDIYTNSKFKVKVEITLSTINLMLWEKRTGLFHFLDMSEKSGSKYLDKTKANEEEVDDEDNDGRRCQDQDLKD